MEIQFSKQAVEDACRELEGNSADINQKWMLIEAKVSEMRHYWEGAFSDHVLSDVTGSMQVLKSVKDYVDKLSNKIYICRNNYDLSEEANILMQKDIDSLFL